MRREGEVSAAQAARLLEVNRKTTLAWAKRVLAQDSAPVSQVRRDAAGRYFFSASEISGMLGGAGDDPSSKF